ncbi:MAG: MBG domain-containing protein [Bacteroidales bacterium]|jgi:hypothetical protein|nr:MBG domain-containing protein [Bacteroidales bacterium]
MKRLFLFILCMTVGVAIADESDFCLTKVTPPLGNNCSGDDLSAAFFSWNTEQNGTVSVTITGLPGNTTTSFRGGTGMNAANLKVTGKAGVTFTGAFTDNSKTVIIFTPSEPLVVGDVLTYSALVEYKTADAPQGGFALQDLWPSLSFTHTFGDVCVPPEPQPLATPSNINISPDNIITFTGDNNALRHQLTVHRGASILPMHIQDVNSGDTVHFDIAGSYTVTLQSFPGSLSFLNSAVSEAQAWVIAGEIPIVEVGETIYCNTSVGEGASEALFTWQTIDNNLVIRIAPVILDDPGTKFRNPMNVARFTVNGFEGTWFESAVLSENNTVLTYVPLVPLLDGDKINYNALVEYATKDNGNLYPTIDFGDYIWGSRCPEAEVLQIPDNIAVTDGVLSFSAVDNALSYKLIVYREQSNLKEYEQILTTTSVPLALNTPGSYTLTLRTVGDNVDYVNSDESPRYEFTFVIPDYKIPVAGVSIFCQFAFDPSAQHGNNDRMVLSWETVGTNIVARISDDEGNFATLFRGDGMRAEALSVNGQSNLDWFTLETNEDRTAVTFIPNIPLHIGDKLVYNGIIEYETGLLSEVALWPVVNMGNYGAYVYGSTCEYATSLVTSCNSIVFTPDTGVRRFTVSGRNFTSPLTVTASNGLTVHSHHGHSKVDTLYPLSNGTLATTPIEVRWQEGSSEGGVVRIEGGGMPFAKEIPVTSNGFSQYCNKVLNYWGEYGAYHVYLTVGHPSDNQMSFLLTPIYGTFAVWSNNSIQAALVSVSRPEVTVVTRVLQDSIIILTFSEALQQGDVISIGPNPAFVWQTENANGDRYYNCYIDPVQTYTVGLTCDLSVPHPAVLPQIVQVDHQPVSLEESSVKIHVAHGTYPISHIHLWELEDKISHRITPLSGDSLYSITGLEEYNTYYVRMAAIDEKGYSSLYENLTIKNLGVLSVSDFNLTDTVVFDGLPHEAEFNLPNGTGEVLSVTYNGLDDPPTDVGDYSIAVSVSEGTRYHAVDNMNIGVLHIVKGGMGAHLLEHTAGTYVYDGEPHRATANIKEDVPGAGSITAIKYNGDTSAPVNADIYVVSVDISEGINFYPTYDLVIDTLVILRAEATADLITFEMDTTAVYNGLPHSLTAFGVAGLGEITLKYNGYAEAINAGTYTVTADVAQGQNYNAASDFVLTTDFSISKGVLQASCFTFPAFAPLHDTGSSVAVTLVEPYTGAGVLTVKYNGSTELPKLAGIYLLSVSAEEGDNFFATEEDIILDSVLISEAQTLTVRIVDENGYTLLSPNFTVTVEGYIDFAASTRFDNELVTVSGKAIFTDIPRGGTFTITAVADGYIVEDREIVSLQQDTVVVMEAIAERSSIEVAEVSAKPVIYTSNGTLFIVSTLPYRTLSLYNILGSRVYSAKNFAQSSNHNISHLPAGMYIVVLDGTRRDTAKVVKM